jgi:hypothetical protein
MNRQIFNNKRTIFYLSIETQQLFESTSIVASESNTVVVSCLVFSHFDFFLSIDVLEEKLSVCVRVYLLNLLRC